MIWNIIQWVLRSLGILKNYPSNEGPNVDTPVSTAPEPPKEAKGGTGSVSSRAAPRKISRNGLSLIKRWEGLRLNSYTDVAGVWTIGYGHTKTARPNQTITETQAEALLLEDVAWAEEAINTYVTVPLTQNQFDALVSWVFNVGADWVVMNGFKDATFIKELNKGNYEAVPAGLRLFVNAGGKRVQGLVNRREDEIRLWNKG